jgi:hypothetical protein
MALEMSIYFFENFLHNSLVFLVFQQKIYEIPDAVDECLVGVLSVPIDYFGPEFTDAFKTIE